MSQHHRIVSSKRLPTRALGYGWPAFFPLVRAGKFCISLYIEILPSCVRTSAGLGSVLVRASEERELSSARGSWLKSWLQGADCGALPRHAASRQAAPARNRAPFLSLLWGLNASGSQAP